MENVNGIERMRKEATEVRKMGSDRDGQEARWMMPKINGKWHKMDERTWYWECADMHPPFIEKCIEGDPNAVRGPGYYAWRLGADDLDYTGPYKTLREAKDAALEGVDIA